MKKNQESNKNYRILILCTFIALLFAFYAMRTTLQIAAFWQLSERAPLQIEALQVKEIKKNSYAIWADFTYQFQEKTYASAAPLGRFFPNPWAAEKEMGELGKIETLFCWFSSKDAEKAILVKKFPWNSLLSSIILAGILLYFCGMALYFQKRA